MRKKIIAANFKMNKTLNEALEYFERLKKLTKDFDQAEIIVAVPDLLLKSSLEVVKGSNIKLSAQNVHWEDKGAFTAETSPLTLKDLGIDHTLIGHSERRKMFCETDETVNKRLKNAIKNDLNVILCIGETLKEREDDKTFDVVKRQITEGLKDINKEQMKNVSIAYEPVWAIGTGRSATAIQAEEVHGEIRKIIKELYDDKVSENLRILYGGSVKPGNIKELMVMENIDGALVGGASLDADTFIKIVKYKD